MGMTGFDRLAELYRIASSGLLGAAEFTDPASELASEAVTKALVLAAERREEVWCHTYCESKDRAD